MLTRRSKRNKDKSTVGLVEVVEIIGEKGSVRKKALLDTGATRSSVDVKIAAKAGIGPIIASVKVKNASSNVSATTGYTRRAVAEARIKLRGKIIQTGVNIVDRQGLPYAILIGRDVIHNNFLIDVSKTHKSNKVGDLKHGKK
jgi:hypothetical protein